MNRHLKGEVNLPGSKSESNRALMIAAYGGFASTVANLSQAHDTTLLRQRLAEVTQGQATHGVVDCEDAGTVARFMMTWLACHPGSWLLTGSQRLCQRPMKPLVDALAQLGAELHYEGEEGCLPMRIRGVDLSGGTVEVDAAQSSQFMSSLLLAAPMWEKGLVLRLGDKSASMPYIDMTLALMRHFGAEAHRDGDMMTVAPQPYRPTAFSVSPDWTAASYWYELAALSDSCDILLRGLGKDSLQGDAILSSWYQAFGVETSFGPEGVRLRRTPAGTGAVREPLSFDFTDHPDLFPAVMATCVALGVPAHFQGTENLAIKESNRVVSIITELEKLFKFTYIINTNYINIYSSYSINIGINKIVFNTYNDHRIAMALAGLLMKSDNIAFDRPEVVAKSYPTFWDDLQMLEK